ncbi:MAG TPA: hypothetical protein VGC32_18590 [Solirubrobacterales bacterium]
MNAHLLLATALGDGDRAALQSLIPLAGAVGAGTIFSLFAGTRRGAALRVFEVFAIVAVLTAAALTAALAIDLLHANEAISNRDLTQTAMPLIVATLLLVVVSVFNRVSESFDRALVLLPMVALAIFAAAELVISSWSIDPGSAIWLVMLIFLVGLALSVAGWGLDRRIRRSDRRVEQAKMRRLVDSGYVPTPIRLVPALPITGDDQPALSGWAHGDARLLGYTGAERLRDLVVARWDSLASGEAAGPVGDSILLSVELQHWVRNVRGSASMKVAVLRPGERVPERKLEIAANDDGLFDVSELVA